MSDDHHTPSAPWKGAERAIVVRGAVDAPPWVRGGARKLLSVRDRLLLGAFQQQVEGGHGWPSRIFVVVGEGDREFASGGAASAGPLALLRALPNMAFSHVPSAQGALSEVTYMLGDSATCEIALRIAASQALNGRLIAVAAVDGPPISVAVLAVLNGQCPPPVGWSGEAKPASHALAALVGVKL